MTDFIVNHLWQSTCFVALAGLLAYALRGNSARVRYWVWLGASLKFLVPLALLMSLGSLIHLPVQRAAAVPAADFPRTFVQLAEHFVPDAQLPHVRQCRGRHLRSASSRGQTPRLSPLERALALYELKRICHT
jgi:hypothetical protein